jgi:hypothetical protein
MKGNWKLTVIWEADPSELNMNDNIESGLPDELEWGAHEPVDEHKVEQLKGHALPAAPFSLRKAHVLMAILGAPAPACSTGEKQFLSHGP